MRRRSRRTIGRQPTPSQVAIGACRIGALDGALARRRRRDRLAPARRHQARRKVGQRREHEQPVPRLAVRHCQRQRRLRRIVAPPGSRPLDLDRVPPEHQQVEVHLARTPSLARLPPERSLEPLERDEQGGRRHAPATWPQHRSRGRRAPPPRCGTRAGRARPRAPWRTAARRPGPVSRAAPPVRGRRPRASRPRRPRWRPAPRMPAPRPRRRTPPSLDSGHARGRGPDPRPGARPGRRPAHAPARRRAVRAGRAPPAGVPRGGARPSR